MSTLLDLVNVGRKVKVGDNEVDVYGVSAEGFVALLVRFPAIMKMMSGSSETMDAQAMMALAPSAVAAFIAAACGNPDNKDAELVASRLPIQSQLDLVETALKLTFPSGVGPFVEKLQGLGVLVQVENQSLPSLGGASMN